MAIKVSGTEVISSSRQLTNITGLDATTITTIEDNISSGGTILGTTTGNATLDLSTGNFFQHTPTADTTFVFSNPPASGTAYNFDLKVTGVEIGGPYDLANASPEFTGLGTLNLSSIDSAPISLSFSSDGTKLYFIGKQNDNLYEYALSTAWDVSTASYTQSFNLSSQEIDPEGLFFKPDGTKFYITGISSDSVHEYTLSTAWDVSTASYTQSLSVSAQTIDPRSVFFKPDGTQMYIVTSSYFDFDTFTTIDAFVWEYILSTPWDISTTTYIQNYSVNTQSSSAQDIFFKADGTKLYIVEGAGGDVDEYTLSTAWNIFSTSYTQSFDISTENTTPRGLFLKDDGTKLFTIGFDPISIHSYNLSTAWNISTSVAIVPTTGYLSIIAQDATPQGLFFKDDGTKLFIIGSDNDSINEYSLSSAWDITTASYVQSFSVSAQEAIASGLFFKPDGTKAYVIGYLGDDVNEYNLSTAWDISTSSYVQNFSVSAQTNAPGDLSFKADGTKMYVIGNNTGLLYEYALSTAWDVSTASYTQSFDISTQHPRPTGLFFINDGTKFFIVGQENNVSMYNLSTSWDISTASFSGVSFNESSSKQDVFFKPDGFSMFILDDSYNALLEYNTGVPAAPSTLTYPSSVSWLDASAPTDPAVGEVLSLQFFTTDGGTTYYGSKNGAVAELSTQTATTTSTTQTAIASYPTASYDAVKVVITVDDGTDRTTTEMVVTWKGTTAYSTEYATVNTGAAALATFDADVSGSNFRILATPAASTSTSFTVKAITV